MAKNRNNFTGIMALLLVGGVYLYRNRSAIQQYFDKMGIQLPEFLGSWTKKSPGELVSDLREGMNTVKKTAQGQS